LLVSCNKKVYIPEYTTQSAEVKTNSSLSIMSFNIQVFGKSKSNKENVMNVIVDIMDDYDLIAIQEIRDASNYTLSNLKKLMPKYSMIIGEREGRSNSKEQYIYLYDDDKFDAIWVESYNDINDEFERPPLLTLFQTDDKALEFIMVDIHIKPLDAYNEIEALSTLIENLYFLYETNIIVVGDFNSDGNYFDERLLDDYFDLNDFKLIITNDLDTTVAPSDNTYDRIIITNDIYKYYKDSGVLYFEDYLPENLEAKKVSDHYPVYLDLEIDHD
jgi:endonuclease/exonuclease/phosphatase family metal-dependent hydrolase